MALEIKNRKIIGTINDLESKLNGELPVNRLELIVLINSHGRENFFFTLDNIKIDKCPDKECYDLSKLDTSQITNMSSIFESSLFNEDISKWNTSNVTNMCWTFYKTINFNQNISNWDVSNVNNMTWMFSETEAFNQNLNSWNVSNVTDMSWMFHEAENFSQALTWDLSNIVETYSMFRNAISFENKFNNRKSLPENTEGLKQWFFENREKMIALDVKDREQSNLENFYSNLDNRQKDME